MQPLVSVVIVGYRRFDLLSRTVHSFREHARWSRLELILADDGSPAHEQEQMRSLPFDKFVLPARNRGLGANTNAGLAAATGDYVLQLQDDWLCTGPDDFLETGVRLMTERPDIGIVRLTDRDPNLAYERIVTASGLTARVYAPPPRSRSRFVYSDNPHLKSRAFMDAIGPYLESRHMQRTELDMCERFNRQTRFKAAFVEGRGVFEHIGQEASHNRPMPLARLSGFLARQRLTRPLILAYRRAKSMLRGS
jgi:glycosyltransferase involved in cell wall biosynthesis